MYERYIREYKHHAVIYGPNTAIFMLVGSFYELYDIPNEEGEYQTSMKRAIDILGIANVEKRGDAPGGKHGRFGGFGAPQLHKYAAMLTRENWTVVILDQEKDAKGKVTNRSVSRILSAGTHVEAFDTQDVYLAGLWLDIGAWTNARSPPEFGVTAIDLTTGSVKTFEGEATGRREAWSSDTLLHFFQVHQPKELVIWWKGDRVDMPEEHTFRRILGIPTAHIHCRHVTASPLDKDIVREDLIRRCFKPKSVLPLRNALGIVGHMHIERSLASLLLFIEDHFPSAMEHLHNPNQWSPTESVYLGNHALTQLNMVTLKESDSVLGIFMKTATPMGRRFMRQRLLYPIADPVKLAKRYEEVEWCINDATFAPHLRQIKDLGRLHRKISLAMVSAIDIIDLDQSYRSAIWIAEAVKKSPLALSTEHMNAFHEYMNDFTASFDIEKARTASEDQFCMTTAASPKVTVIEANILATHTQLQLQFKQLEDWLGVSGGLRMEMKEASVVLSGGKGVMKAAAERLKGVIPVAFQGTVVHAKRASSSLEVPALNELYAKILQLRESLWQTVKEELPNVCDAVATKHVDTWDCIEAWIAQVDVSATIAQVSVEQGYCRPELINGDSASIELIGLRHPLIEGQTTRLEYVKHDVSLDSKGPGWLIYGMNASGKSSLMKATGIAVLLAQCGCYVPAMQMRLNPFRSLFTRILSTDNLWAGLSSFAVEMTELAEALRRADPWSLVLGDEVCSGTESMSAMAIVSASLKWLQDKGSRFMFATHLHGLPVADGIQIWHLRVRYDAAADRLIYDRTLHPGAGSSLYGIEVAKAMGIPIEVLDAAHKIRRELLDEKTEATATTSQWNTNIQKRVCEICEAAITRDLEVHHIRQQKDATEGRFTDGTDMNSPRNLIVVCQTCHDKHHAGEIHIGPLKQTSDGPVREVDDIQARLAPFAYRIPEATEEEIAKIGTVLKAYPNMPITRLLIHLEQHLGVRISQAKLRAIRAKLT
jgi:DNA mismatch repair protein MutS